MSLSGSRVDIICVAVRLTSGPVAALPVALQGCIRGNRRAELLLCRFDSEMVTPQPISQSWAAHFGLAEVPLFSNGGANTDGSHCVLLDGGYGSFALSDTQEPLWKKGVPANWSWSSNLPHHVTVTDGDIAVVRWDKTDAEIFTRRSVEDRLPEFYDYLANDRVQSNQRVVEHMIRTFRRVRSLVANARLPDARSIDAYLAVLQRAMQSATELTTPATFVPSTTGEGDSLLGDLPESGIESIVDSLTGNPIPDLPLRLVPSLAIRHAGSEIFQEAHFELLRAPSPNLFGYIGPAESRPVTRGVAHFTPPALARSVAEQTLRQVPELASRERLVVLDPACGSGAFLHEALRTLRRLGFKGNLVLLGRDVSAPAISMARLVLSIGVQDWSPRGGCEVDLRLVDSLSADLPPADVVLMNPPFVSWAALTSGQREQVRDVLGGQFRGRADYSMAFITRALDALEPRGVLGTLLPASLLTLRVADRWREYLVERANLRFIASLSDYSLFTYAMVQIAAVVLTTAPSSSATGDPITAITSSSDPMATSSVLRALRKGDSAERESSSDWHLFTTSSKTLASRPTWRLTPPSTERALTNLLDSGRVVRIADIFTVRQGVRTGENKAFLLPLDELNALPKSERKWFRKAVTNSSIRDGRIHVQRSVFYPYHRDSLAFRTEGELIRSVPMYYHRYLEPRRTSLMNRHSLGESRRDIWWSLSRHRKWELEREPRIVSKYFGAAGAFAIDLDSEYVVVQGFSWFLRDRSISQSLDSGAEDDRPELADILYGYAGVFNSRVFGRLLRIFSPHVVGGQFDLSPRYVGDIPIPDLAGLMTDEKLGSTVANIAMRGLRANTTSALWRHRTDAVVTELYGSGIVAKI